MYEYNIEFGAIRGLGPGEIIKTIYVGLDDIDPNEYDGDPEPIVRDIAVAQAMQEMRDKGFTRFWVREIHNG